MVRSCRLKCLVFIQVSLFPQEDRERRSRCKEIPRAFKLAASKRINSPRTLDLLIRAVLAFLRGLEHVPFGFCVDLPACSVHFLCSHKLFSHTCTVSILFLGPIETTSILLCISALDQKRATIHFDIYSV